MPTILITGASGLIGTRIQEMLLNQGYNIHALGRSVSRSTDKRIKAFRWDIINQQIDEKALDGVDAIIHLAGAGVADKRWTAARKKEIMDSRIEATKLLYNTLAHRSHQVRTIISASAVGYYGDCGDEIVTEDHPVADTFLAKVTQKWEEEVSKMDILGIRHVCCRIGIVLSKHGGALPELVKTMPMGVAGYFAKSHLYYPWIHIDDVCGIMIHALENETMRGSYNSTGPDPVTIKDLMKAIITAKKSNAILTPIPSFVLKLAVGEMADMLLSSQRCSNEKLIQTGYKFYFPTVEKALADIYL